MTWRIASGRMAAEASDRPKGRRARHAATTRRRPLAAAEFSFDRDAQKTAVPAAETARCVPSSRRTLPARSLNPDGWRPRSCNSCATAHGKLHKFPESAGTEAKEPSALMSRDPSAGIAGNLRISCAESCKSFPRGSIPPLAAKPHWPGHQGVLAVISPQARSYLLRSKPGRPPLVAVWPNGLAGACVRPGFQSAGPADRSFPVTATRASHRGCKARVRRGFPLSSHVYCTPDRVGLGGHLCGRALTSAGTK